MSPTLGAEFFSFSKIPLNLTPKFQHRHILALMQSCPHFIRHISPIRSVFMIPGYQPGHIITPPGLVKTASIRQNGKGQEGK